MSRSRPFWSNTNAITTTPQAIALPDGWSQLKVEVDTKSYGRLGAEYVPPSVSTVAGIYTIDSGGVPDDGTFLIRIYPFEGDLVETADIDFDATAAEIKTALTDTLLFATADITAGGGALPTTVTLQFQGVFEGVFPMIELVHDVSGGTNSQIRMRQTTLPVGNGGYGFLNANTQEFWEADPNGSKADRFLQIAALSGSGNVFVTAYH